MAPEEKTSTGTPGDAALEALLAKVKAVIQSPHGNLFEKIVDSFYEHLGEEYFSPEDQADIREGLEEIKRGEHVSWEECKRKYQV